MTHHPHKALIATHDEGVLGFLASVLDANGVAWDALGAMREDTYRMVFLDADLPAPVSAPILHAIRDGALATGTLAVMGCRRELPALGEEHGTIAFLEKPLDSREVANVVRGAPSGGIGLRRTPRIELARTPALARLGEALHMVRVIDLSPGGLGLEALGPNLACGVEEVGLKLPVTGELVLVQVRPVWSAGAPERAGVEFVKLGNRAKSMIADEVRASLAIEHARGR